MDLKKSDTKSVHSHEIQRENKKSFAQWNPL